ncbi:MAG TPA: hypothetical protein DCY13_07275 [Verrucomicrobiales bacterium]|nr:hypothetical protein [Verrucomicrobiales bacterium]
MNARSAVARFCCALLMVLGFTSGCSKDPSIGCYYVEIAPEKFVPVQFNRDYRTDMFIEYEGRTVVFKLPGRYPDEPNSASTLMEYEGRLYVIALDASKPGRDAYYYRFWRQKDQTFEEIEAKEFPRSIAILNIWRPGRFTQLRYSTGMTEDDKIDQVALIRNLDPEDKYFLNSYQARLWYMLENRNSLGWAEREFSWEEASMFLHEYIERYQPVKLSSMEMRPVPEGECDF